MKKAQPNRHNIWELDQEVIVSSEQETIWQRQLDFLMKDIVQKPDQTTTIKQKAHMDTYENMLMDENLFSYPGEIAPLRALMRNPKNDRIYAINKSQAPASSAKRGTEKHFQSFNFDEEIQSDKPHKDDGHASFELLADSAIIEKQACRTSDEELAASKKAVIQLKP